MGRSYSQSQGLVAMIGENRFTFVCPMFNAAATLPRLLHSLFGQTYENWHIILIDDVSEASEREVERVIIKQFQEMLGCKYLHRITTLWNTQKQWEVANVLRGIKMCEVDDIVCRIDADDMLCDLNALHMLNTVYVTNECDAVWSMHRWGHTHRNISGPLPPRADPYTHSWVTSHLKTFRKYLIHGVPYTNFVNMNGDLVRRCGDQAIYLPVLKRAKNRVFFPQVLYHYTIDEQGGAVYHTADAIFQKAEADFIRARGYISE